jgi:hypothetical protein
MTDLDFDEIDRAVNSATTANKTGDNESSTETKPDLTPDAPKEAPDDKSKSTLVGRRSSGQFMDVVHPSSDMRRSTIVMPERPIPSKSVETPSQPVEPAKTLTPTPEDKPKNDWPDPIEFGASKDAAADKESDKKPEIDEGDDIDEINQEISRELDEKPADDLPETPFIPGTKVEKRPLGAFSDDKVGEKPNSESVGDTKPNEGADLSAENGLSADDLEEKLVQIESDDTSKPESSQKTAAAEKMTTEKPSSTPAPVAEKTAPIEATSINQQYQEKPSTGEKTSGAIYDTEAYHKALAHPPKKKSGWMWVVWILLIIILGAVIGVLVYMYI